jgi:diadenosine tetraphosphate (Ap4A) HIT family hydrolase
MLTQPTAICSVPSGTVLLANIQYPRGYCILMAEPSVFSINTLERSKRAEFLCDMALVGDALIEVTGAYRVNYAVFGNTDPVLHAHIVPRFLSEPDDLRHGVPWTLFQNALPTDRFDPVRDRDLMRQLARAIQTRL